jgi:hypothetical protein
MLRVGRDGSEVVLTLHSPIGEQSPLRLRDSGKCQSSASTIRTPLQMAYAKRNGAMQTFMYK